MPPARPPVHALVPPAARTRRLEPGDVDLDAFGDGAEGLLLVTAGLLLVHVELVGTTATEVLGPGDVLRLGAPADELLRSRWTLEVVEPSRVAVLDGQLEELVQRSPAIAERLVRSGGDRARRQLLHRGLCQLPRVEDRVLTVLWLLAERWGRLTPEGVELPFALSHKLLGRLVGAARSTVTTAVGTLVDAGHVSQPTRGRLLLDPTSRHAVSGG